MKKNAFGVFEITVAPNEHGQVAIPHNSKIKVTYHPACFFQRAPG